MCTRSNYNSGNYIYKVSDIDWKNWEPEELSTIMFVVEENRVLLIHKKEAWVREKQMGQEERSKKADSHAMRDKRDQ